MKYRGLLSDFDGTIHHQDRVVSPPVTRAIQSLKQRGVPFGLITGRQFAYLQPYLHANHINGVHVVCGGAELVDAQGKTLFEQPIAGEVAQFVAALVDKAGGCFFLKQHGASYANAAGLRYYGTRNLGVPQYLLSDISNWQALAFYISRIDDETLAQLQAIPELTVIKQRFRPPETGFFLDVTAAGVSKMSGAAQWCAYHGLDPAEVIGIGDGENDLELFQSVGLKLAMGNAVPELKSAADAVIPSLEADGVAWAIRKYFVE